MTAGNSSDWTTVTQRDSDVKRRNWVKGKLGELTAETEGKSVKALSNEEKDAHEDPKLSIFYRDDLNRQNTLPVQQS